MTLASSKVAVGQLLNERSVRLFRSKKIYTCYVENYHIKRFRVSNISAKKRQIILRLIEAINLMFLKTMYGLNKSILTKGCLKLPLPTRLETQNFLHSFS